jgi:hypothetical protein
MTEREVLLNAIDALCAAQPAPVPLTDERVNEILHAQPGALTHKWFIDFARAIERAHGIGDKP